ncbi:M23 family metallopeptidase [Acidaminobacter hydrogenoformans]|uniref:Murein DD-endopeptidase MepM and murein hydrolase activator NlpD, contain LysM domain n=1 Tax=Acidaminobacter hydrogenoformans DSM 2784 TaxID=1120920 RepID=A0A1G5RR88_9FIRM|nr:M23 family metallopeptidase [Acidaminobacter hydrogenoformans]SCZ76593.1 Murein DD-endopeptidase MepM and murein hydrolase activator NlpD, contain LysM domain [Acidaminobacter hydrogenoformans DSM 2784]
MQLKQIQKRIVKGFENSGEMLRRASGKTPKKLDSSVGNTADFDQHSRVNFLKRNRYATSAVAAMLLVAVSSVFTLESGAFSTEQTAEVQAPKQAILAMNYEEVSVSEKMPLIPGEKTEGAADLNEIVESSASFDAPFLKGYTVKIDGEEYGFFKSEREAQSVLDTLMAAYIADKDIVEAYFKETVEVAAARKEAGAFKAYSVPENAVEYIKRGTDQEKVHIVEAGENFWTISEKYQISVGDLEKANPEITPERLQIGTKVSLMVPVPLVTVCTVEKAIYTEQIAFETVYEEDSSAYQGVNKIAKSGEHGEREVVANIYRMNGLEMNREILNENILKEPTTKVVVKGTKVRPPTVGSGVLAKPVSRGTVTSPFGTRWGRRHNGIDIGLPTGSSIKAADGGTVIFSGYDGGYGYTVRISHGDGMVTVYAHNSKLQVKKGDKVYKGQQIALSGNSGSSTGPHLHFEVRIDGVPKNPLNFFKF